jgi:hypothetical protein
VDCASHAHPSLQVVSAPPEQVEEGAEVQAEGLPQVGRHYFGDGAGEVEVRFAVGGGH